MYRRISAWQKRVARILDTEDGRFYWMNERTGERSELDYANRSAAMRAACEAGYTHACGLTTWADGRVKRIPTYLRDTTR